MKKACEGLNPESLERTNTRQQSKEGGEDKTLIKPFRGSGGMLPREIFIFGSSELAGNGTKTDTRYELCLFILITNDPISKAEATMAKISGMNRSSSSYHKMKTKEFKFDIPPPPFCLSFAWKVVLHYSYNMR